MKKLVIVAVCFCAALASCQGSKSIKSFSTNDSLSYAAGVMFASNLYSQDSTLVGALLAAGYEDVFAKKAKMTADEANAFINEWFSVRLPAKTKSENAEWLEKVKAENSDIQITESGLMYQIINPGDQSVKAVNDADQVTVNYRGTLKDGFEFDKRDSTTFALNRVIAAWTEGMKLVGKGGEVVLWAPAEIAYGPGGRGQIPGNAALKFEIKLIDVIPAATETAE